MLAGCLNSYGDPNDVTLGTKANPFEVENLRTDNALVFYVRNCGKIGYEISNNFGSTSAAAPLISAYIASQLDKLPAKASAVQRIQNAKDSMRSGIAYEVFSCKESPEPCKPGEIGKAVNKSVNYTGSNWVFR